MEEVWKNIEGYGGMYQVSSLGRIRSAFDGKVLPLLNEKDACRVSLKYEGKRNRRGVATIVAKAFIGEPPTEWSRPKHKDGNPLNNKAENLCWDVRGVVDIDRKPPAKRGRPSLERRMFSFEERMVAVEDKLDDIIDLIKSGAVASGGVPDEAYEHLRADVDAVKEIVSKLPPTAADTIRNAEMMMEENGFYD